MPVLKNARHERFAQELAMGKTQVEAYEVAGYVANDSNSSKMARNPKILARVAEITGKAAQKAAVTVASILEELEEARALARKIKQPSTMATASLGKAKVAGLVAEKHEHTGRDGGPIETKEVSDIDAARRIAHILRDGLKAKEENI